MDPADERILVFRNWLVKHGGDFHPDAHFIAVSSGFFIIANKSIPSDTAVVLCPFSLFITPKTAQTAILETLDRSHADVVDKWSDRQLICLYLCLHWMIDAGKPRKQLAHLPYLETLPRPDQLLTPLHFTPAELEAFKGTNLYGATLDRERAWKQEWKQCFDLVSSCHHDLSGEFTWTRYLTASTYVSSRAFPSTILSHSPSIAGTTASHPVLIPGVDALNHSRGHPVSWVVSGSPSSEGFTMSLVIHAATPAGSELLNNYGPKPNSELILGYGFSLPNNPDDTIVLSIGGAAASNSTKKKWTVGRSANGVEGLWDEVLCAVSQAPLDDADGGDGIKPFVDQLDAASMLSQMCQAFLDRLQCVYDRTEIRPQVLLMLEHYLEGQRDILGSIMTFAQAKEEEAIQLARQKGVELDAE